MCLSVFCLLGPCCVQVPSTKSYSSLSHWAVWQRRIGWRCWGTSTKRCVYMHSQADTCSAFMHRSFVPTSRARLFGNQRDVTAWLIGDCFFWAKTWGLASPPRAKHYKARHINLLFSRLVQGFIAWVLLNHSRMGRDYHPKKKQNIALKSPASYLIFLQKVNRCPARLKHNIKELAVKF